MSVFDDALRIKLIWTAIFSIRFQWQGSHSNKQQSDEIRKNLEIHAHAQ